MIYHLIEYLKELGIDIPGQGLFSYLSFMAIISFTIALLISIFAGKRIIRWIQKSRSEKRSVTWDLKVRCRRKVPRRWAES